VDHRRHVELAELFVEREPPGIGDRRIVPAAAGRIGIEVAADEAQFGDAALQFLNAAGGRCAWRLRQLADGGEIARVEAGNAMDQVIGYPAPVLADGFVTDMVLHGAGDRREDGEVMTPLAHQLQLRALQTVADLVVAELRVGWRGTTRLERVDLPAPESLQRRRSGGVVAVAIDDHEGFLGRWSACR
jgi:hypothetical protein